MAPRKKTGKGKGLAFPPSPHGFPALPLDILYEPFRRFLLNRANVGIWRAAFSVLHADGLPACPPYASEPAWARLVFEKVCNICCTTLRDNPHLDPVWWEFSARYCGGCMASQVGKTTSQKLKRIDPKRSWKAVFPSVPRNRDSRDHCRYYLVAHQTQLIDACNKTEDPAARAAIIQARIQETLLITQHSDLWRSWGRKQIEGRRIEAANRQAEKEKKLRDKENARVEAIVAKLTALGWSDEPWMNGGKLATQIRYYPSVVVPQNLTPRCFSAYRDLEPVLLSKLTADKRTCTLRPRLHVFGAAFPMIITETQIANLALSIRPRLSDVALIPEVRALLDQEGEEPVEENELATALRPVMPRLLQKWVGDTIARIGEYAAEQLGVTSLNPQPGSSNNSSKEIPVDPLSLAIAIVTCPRKCGAAAPIATLLKHPCPSDPANWLPCFRASLSSRRRKRRRRPFTPAVFDFASRLGAVEGVVRAYGRDPKRTTRAEMEGEQRLVRCSACAERAKDRRGCAVKSGTILSDGWAAALEHSLKAHLNERDAKIEWELSGDSVPDSIPPDMSGASTAQNL
ncbi:hypothetical protein B0H14DRAFT_2661600 [Mycena olivaceomarginata]|nr:hypothetical protein B0H14DRAFT_2661600 [Mycena olivaceomarginata]